VTLIVDGYNVIHAVPELERQLDRSLEAAREGLVGLCREYRARRGDAGRVWVVFDGSAEYPSGLHSDRGGVRVVFTQEGEEADERILRLVRDDQGRSEFLVVSNDTQIVNNARGLGARVISGPTFYRQARPARAPRSTPSATGERAGLSADEAQRITEEYRKRLEGRS